MDVGTWLAMCGGATVSSLAGIGSAIGIWSVARVATGVLSEAPEKFGSLLTLSILPGTQGIYGLVLAFMVLMKIRMHGGAPMEITIEQGLRILLACIPIGAVECISAVFQGRVAADGVPLVAKRSEQVGQAMTLAVLVEMYALFGLILGIFFIIFGF
jgi:V/A-type H+-transporting ATPase subunit K